VGGEHLAGDLGVAWLVRADEAELVSAEEGCEAVEEQKETDGDEDEELAGGDGEGVREEPARPAPARWRGGIGSVVSGDVGLGGCWDLGHGHRSTVI
jgi:hypothetical protein